MVERSWKTRTNSTTLRIRHRRSNNIDLLCRVTVLLAVRTSLSARVRAPHLRTSWSPERVHSPSARRPLTTMSRWLHRLEAHPALRRFLLTNNSSKRRVLIRKTLRFGDRPMKTVTRVLGRLGWLGRHVRTNRRLNLLLQRPSGNPQHLRPLDRPLKEIHLYLTPLIGQLHPELVTFWKPRMPVSTPHRGAMASSLSTTQVVLRLRPQAIALLPSCSVGRQKEGAHNQVIRRSDSPYTLFELFNLHSVNCDILLPVSVSQIGRAHV